MVAELDIGAARDKEMPSIKEVRAITAEGSTEHAYECSRPTFKAGDP